MCELFALSAAEPQVPGAELECFWTHSQRHPDGWGIAYALDGAPLIVKRPFAAARDPLTRTLCRFRGGRVRGLQSRAIVAHIRRTSRGNNLQQNTHPFERELFGRSIVFAHNGDLPMELFAKRLRHYQPIGDTDSERAFCRILDSWQRLGPAASQTELLDGLVAVTNHIEHPNRKFNYLLLDGERLYCHWSGYVALRWQASTVRAADGSEVAQIVVASQPVNGGVWRRFKRGEILVIEKGQIIDRRWSVAATMPPAGRPPRRVSPSVAGRKTPRGRANGVGPLAEPR